MPIYSGFTGETILVQPPVTTKAIEEKTGIPSNNQVMLSVNPKLELVPLNPDTAQFQIPKEKISSNTFFIVPKFFLIPTIQPDDLDLQEFEMKVEWYRACRVLEGVPPEEFFREHPNFSEACCENIPMLEEKIRILLSKIRVQRNCYNSLSSRSQATYKDATRNSREIFSKHEKAKARFGLEALPSIEKVLSEIPVSELVVSGSFSNLLDVARKYLNNVSKAAKPTFEQFEEDIEALRKLKGAADELYQKTSHNIGMEREPADVKKLDALRDQFNAAKRELKVPYEVTSACQEIWKRNCDVYVTVYEELKALYHSTLNFYTEQTTKFNVVAKKVYDLEIGSTDLGKKAEKLHVSATSLIQTVDQLQMLKLLPAFYCFWIAKRLVSSEYHLNFKKSCEHFVTEAERFNKRFESYLLSQSQKIINPKYIEQSSTKSLFDSLLGQQFNGPSCKVEPVNLIIEDVDKQRKLFIHMGDVHKRLQVANYDKNVVACIESFIEETKVSSNEFTKKHLFRLEQYKTLLESVSNLKEELRNLKEVEVRKTIENPYLPKEGTPSWEQVRALEERIRKLEHQLQHVYEEKERQKEALNELTSLRNQVEELQVELAKKQELANEWIEVDVENKHDESYITNLQMGIQQQEEKFNAEKAQLIATLNEKEDKLNYEKQALEKKNEELLTKLNDLEQAKEGANVLQKKCKEESDRNATLNVTIKDLTAQLQELQEKEKNMLTELTALKQVNNEELNVLKEKLNQETQKNAGLTSELDENRKKLSKLETDVDLLKEILELEKVRAKTLEEALENKEKATNEATEEQILSLTGKVEELQKQLTEERKLLAENHERLETLQNQHANLQKENEQVTSEIKGAREKEKSLQEELAATKKELERQKNELGNNNSAEMEQKYNHLLQEHNQKIAELDTLQKRVADLDGNVKQLTSQIQTLQEQEKVLKNDYKVQHDNYIQAAQQIQKLNNEIEQGKKRHTAEIKAKDAKIAELQSSAVVGSSIDSVSKDALRVVRKLVETPLNQDMGVNVHLKGFLQGDDGAPSEILNSALKYMDSQFEYLTPKGKLMIAVNKLRAGDYVLFFPFIPANSPSGSATANNQTYGAFENGPTRYTLSDESMASVKKKSRDYRPGWIIGRVVMMMDGENGNLGTILASDFIFPPTNQFSN